MRDMLETPVPIIVVVRAKLVGALLEFVPGNAVERHPHIVFARDPGDHFGLLDETQDICYRALSLQTGRSRDNRSVAVRSIGARMRERGSNSERCRIFEYGIPPL